MGEKKYHYYELYTEYGSLYLYEIEDDYNKEVHEFFTGNNGEYGYGTLSFNEGESTFTIREKNMQGEITNEYLKELEPYDFLMKVAPFLKDKESKMKKMAKVGDIFYKKANNIPNKEAIKPDPEVSKEQKKKVE